jgi:hypothetical protein
VTKICLVLLLQWRVLIDLRAERLCGQLARWDAKCSAQCCHDRIDP